MKTIVRAIAVAAAFAAVGSTASAQSMLSNANVTVSVTLTSQCKWTTSAPAGLAVAFGTYTAFRNTPLTPATPATFSVTCTRNFGTSPTVTWDTTNGTNTGIGVLAGLQYSLSVTGGAPTPGTAADTTTIGTGDVIVYTLSGSMPADQAGTATAGLASHVRQLTMSF